MRVRWKQGAVIYMMLIYEGYYKFDTLQARLQPRDVKNLLGEDGEATAINRIVIKHINITLLFYYYYY